MSTSYPGAIDTFVNPLPTSDTVIVPHSTQHTNINDSVLALETKVGANASAVTTTHDYKLSGVTGVDKAVGASQTVTMSNKTNSSPKVIVGSDAIGDTLYNSSGATGVQSRIPVGSTGQVYTVAGGIPSWQSPSSTNTSYIADTGTANAYIATLVPAIASYVAGQLVQFKATNANTTASTVNVNGLGAKTIKKLGGATDLVSGDIAAGMVVQLEYDGTNFVMLNPVANAPITSSGIKFGGTGVDGALTVSSGNTNIDLGGAAYFLKNYSSISITGTGSVTFINPNAAGTVIHLKCSGNTTLTSSAAPMLDASGCGAAFGAKGVNSGSATAGTDITTSFAIYSTTTNSGGRPANGAGGAASTAISNPNFYGTGLRALTLGNERLPILLIPGAGGGGGSSNNNPSSPGVSGDGGNGGGALYIECGGSWNFTTANGISVAGKNGGNFTGTTNMGGGGGGGGGGMFLAFYNTLIANSGTVNVSGGTGGTNASGLLGTAYGGGGGSSFNGSGGAGNSTGGAVQGTGGAGIAQILQNNSIS